MEKGVLDGDGSESRLGLFEREGDARRYVSLILSHAIIKVVQIFDKCKNTKLYYIKES